MAEADEGLGQVLEIRLSTRDLPRPQQFEFYRNARCRAIAPVRLELENADQGFRADMSFRRFGPLQLSCTDADWSMRGPARHIRERPEIARTRSHSLLLACNLEGQNGLDYRNSPTISRIEPGSWMLLSTEDRMVGTCYGPRARQVMVRIPVEAAALLPRFAGRFFGKPQPPNNMANALVSGYLKTLVQYPVPDAAQAAAMGRHLVDLIAVALNRTTEQSEASENGVRAALIAAAERQIEAHYLNQEFSPAHAAASLGITSRYLHKILEPTGISFSTRVMRRRLRHAQELLSFSPYARGILSVALDSGFRNAEHFSQRFRAAFGMTPREFRDARRAK